MRNSITKTLTGAAASGCLLAVLAAWPSAAGAQTHSRPESAPVLPAPSAPSAPGQSNGRDAEPPELREKLPDDAVERARKLDNLYALLATAEDEQSAEQASNAILQLWANSGSDTITVLMARASKALAGDNLSLAQRMLDTVVEQAPDYAEGWSQRAQVLYLQGEAHRALGDLRRALALDPNHFRALSALGHILREYGEKKGALTAYRKLLEVHPFADGAQTAVEELERDVSGQGI